MSIILRPSILIHWLILAIKTRLEDDSIVAPLLWCRCSISVHSSDRWRRCLCKVSLTRTRRTRVPLSVSPACKARRVTSQWARSQSRAYVCRCEHLLTDLRTDPRTDVRKVLDCVVEAQENNSTEALQEICWHVPERRAAVPAAEVNDLRLKLEVDQNSRAQFIWFLILILFVSRIHSSLK